MAKKSVKTKAKTKAQANAKVKTNKKVKTKPVLKTKVQAKVSAKVKAQVKPKTTLKAKPKSVQKSVVLKSKPNSSVQNKVNTKQTKQPKNIVKIQLETVATVKQDKSAKKVATKTKSTAKLLNEGAPFSPLGDKVLIKKAEAFSGKTAGGLYIPASAQEKPTEGSVVAIGPGIKTKKGFLKPLDVKVGDKVMYEKFAGMELKFDGQEFLILTENEIIGVVS